MSGEFSWDPCSPSGAGLSNPPGMIRAMQTGRKGKTRMHFPCALQSPGVRPFHSCASYPHVTAPACLAMCSALPEAGRRMPRRRELMIFPFASWKLGHRAWVRERRAPCGQLLSESSEPPLFLSQEPLTNGLACFQDSQWVPRVVQAHFPALVMAQLT